MKSKYSWQQIYLHWISAVIIIWATLTGFYASFLPQDNSVKEVIGFINVSLTTLFIPFFILRIFFCCAHGKPAVAPAQMKTQRIAHLVHMILYTNITIVLVTGVLMMDRAINVFNLIEIPSPLDNPEYIKSVNKTHIFFCATLGVLVLLHILAVIKHQLSGNTIIHRMRPW